MRLSADRNDPGFSPDAWDAGWRVFLNGAELKNCVTADEERGEVLVHVLDEKGHPKLDWARKEVVTEVRRGTVRLERVADHA